jgi:hypothetical protein
MKILEASGSASERTKVSSDLEKEQARRLGLAREVLMDNPAFNEMAEGVQESMLRDTASVVATIEARCRGHYRGTDPDALWASLNWGYSSKTAASYPFGRFRTNLGDSASTVIKTLFQMLRAGVETKKALAEKSNPPDPFGDLRSGPRYVGKKRRAL